MRERIIQTVKETLLQPRWVVDEDGDPGIAFGRGPFRMVIGYHKWPDRFLIGRIKSDHRVAKKRELNVHRRMAVIPTCPGDEAFIE